MEDKELQFRVDFEKKIRAASTEPEKVTTVLKELRGIWKDWLKRYRLKFPICCETCSHVGEAMWHCHCPESPQDGLNVFPSCVCSHWRPNAGLMIFIERRVLAKEREEFLDGPTCPACGGITFINHFSGWRWECLGCGKDVARATSAEIEKDTADFIKQLKKGKKK